MLSMTDLNTLFEVKAQEVASTVTTQTSNNTTSPHEQSWGQDIGHSARDSEYPSQMNNPWQSMPNTMGDADASISTGAEALFGEKEVTAISGVSNGTRSDVKIREESNAESDADESSTDAGRQGTRMGVET